ncbi:MAG TPA: NADH-quinone oxidoreductase subunit NuoE [Nitrospiria bacterium]|jgi:NADH-quinone oxidoreductase E subunit
MIKELPKRYSDEIEMEVREILGQFPLKRSALLPILHLVQREEGYISEEAMRWVARVLDLTPIQVYEVVTFYTLFNQKPVGKYHLQVCKTLSCALVGAGQLISHLENKLGIKVGETTEDGLFTLKTVECLASCGTSPMMQVNDAYYENLNGEKVDALLEELRAKATN